MFCGPLSYYMPYLDVNVAALLAVKYAILMFERSEYCNRNNVVLDVETDSNLAVSWIGSQFGNPRELFADLKEITMALGRIQNHVEFCYNWREYQYGGEHYHQVHQLAVEALDTPIMCPVNRLEVDRNFAKNIYRQSSSAAAAAGNNKVATRWRRGCEGRGSTTWKEGERMRDEEEI
ncbi:hypothetical protein SOVF_150390 [Spinacia oleracea]|nr:hypothetical protein SOVF_150390 [Spinacia oleracea]